jgi:hypothetical protein
MPTFCIAFYESYFYDSTLFKVSFFQKYRQKLSLFGDMKVQKNRHKCAICKYRKKIAIDNIDNLVGLRLSFCIRILLIGGQYWFICAEYRHYRTVHVKNLQQNKYFRRRKITYKVILLIIKKLLTD